MLHRSPQPFPRFSENLLQGQSSPVVELVQPWPSVEPSGPIQYYNISLHQPGMYQDYRKTVGAGQL